MAIEYERVNWDTTKYVNPTNMNQMDAGIKAACDGVDENGTQITAINSKLGNLIKVKIYEFSNVHIDTRSSAGAYYKTLQTVGIEGYTKVVAYLSDWSGMSTNISVYSTSNLNSVEVTSNVEQTISTLKIGVLFIKSEFVS